MKKVKKDIDSLSLKQKELLLKELKQEELLDLFKDRSKYTYKPAKLKKAALDQQVAISIAKDEKDYIGKELMEIRKLGPAVSISSFIRNRAIMDVDIGEWYDKAIEGLNDLTSSAYNEKELNRQRSQYIKLLDDIDDEDKETVRYYSKRINEIEERISEIKRILPKRGYRLCGRVTFNEANTIRWRAARLSLSVADYMRFVVFNYLPHTKADRHMTVDARKRFYICILDVYKNGWGDPPVMNECPNCARLQKDIEILKNQLSRYRMSNY